MNKAKAGDLETLAPRILGIETEYGLTCASTSGGNPPLTPEEAAKELFAPIVNKYRSTSAFLENGGRLYLDVGAHPEYASAETTGLREILIQDRAGNEHLRALIAQANYSLEKKQVPGRIHLFKNNLDSVGNSCGCHENYSLARSKDYREFIDSLVPYLVSRQIITGSGWLRATEAGVKYCFSQRAYQIDDSVSGATTRSRPLVNTRDEPHADPEHYRRLHVISGDTNVLEAPTLFKFGASNMLLTALEHGMEISDLQIANPITALREITSDLSGKITVELRDGRRLTAIDLQEELRIRTGNFLRNVEFDDLYAQVWRIWDMTIAAFRSGDTNGLAFYLDWAAKRQLISRYQEKTGADLSDSRVGRLDLAYHDISDSGLRLDSKGLAKRYTCEAEIEEGLHLPPQTTRAKLRGELIRMGFEHRIDVFADWTHLRIGQSDLSTVVLLDPFATNDERVEQLLQWIEEGQ